MVKLEIKNVTKSFTRNEGKLSTKINAVENINLSVKDGEFVCFVGPSGCGKSTLIKSLVNLIESEGSVKIDGVDTREISDGSYKGLVSYVPQNAILFNETVMTNIKYGNYKICDEEVYRISMSLGIHESIIKLENGYYTNVGEQGKNLSGGERQKILILRCVLRQPQILLMDEATSNLDKLSEMRIMKKILSDEETTIMAIIHNLELLPLFNRILWIHDGKIEDLQDRDSIDFNQWYDTPNYKGETTKI